MMLKLAREALSRSLNKDLVLWAVDQDLDADYRLTAMLGGLLRKRNRTPAVISEVINIHDYYSQQIKERVSDAITTVLRR
jgi:hypothetical protein